MQYQLNPHLLKNVLNSILSHTYYTMDKLAQVLDFVLYESANKLVSPFEHIAFIENSMVDARYKVMILMDGNSLNLPYVRFTHNLIAWF